MRQSSKASFYKAGIINREHHKGCRSSTQKTNTDNVSFSKANNMSINMKALIKYT